LNAGSRECVEFLPRLTQRASLASRAPSDTPCSFPTSHQPAMALAFSGSRRNAIQPPLVLGAPASAPPPSLTAQFHAPNRPTARFCPSHLRDEARLGSPSLAINESDLD